MSGRLASVAIAVMLGLAGGHGARAEPAAQADAIERARVQVLDDSYQAELPRYRAGAGSSDGAEASGGTAARPRRQAGGELGAEQGRRARIDVRAHDDTDGSWPMRIAMWGLVVVIGVLAALWGVSELARGGDAELLLDADGDGGVAAARAAIIERPLGDADELARRGEFAEAIHTLLLRTLQELARSAAVRVAPATTSREILARVPLLADARSALAGLITAVEITHFGDEPASAADYERCRQQFHVFAAALGRGGPGRREAAAA